MTKQIRCHSSGVASMDPLSDKYLGNPPALRKQVYPAKIAVTADGFGRWWKVDTE
ncbi:MAG: hypothetical protein OXE59_10760 [Bacteroidetes bacterium]|nr:hypothetical protein [Bacteroidota bacterium]